MTDRGYFLDRYARREHLHAGQPRRFIDLTFQGVGAIVSPVRPGSAPADARVTAADADQLGERQAAAFVGWPDEDAAVIASRILDLAG